MWQGWQDLESASSMAEVPFESIPVLHMAIEMLLATDVQWDRFLSARDAPRERRSTDAPWSVEVHFFLVAADDASDRLAFWAKALDDDDARAFASRLRDSDVKAFRHHQEHLEERMPGGKNEAMAHLSAPGNELIHIQGEAPRVTSINTLINGTTLTFGDERLDLEAAHARVLEVARDLLAWLRSRSRFPDAR